MYANPNIDESWIQPLRNVWANPKWQEIKSFLQEELKNKQIIYPPMSKIFNAFNLCKYDALKIVIIGQDPYHGPNQANGLCFSVEKNIPIPPSLKNIFKEIKDDLQKPSFNPKTGDLSNWASQGVLLLNSSLTVRKNIPASHANIGWQEITDQIISEIEQKGKIIFMLWGNYAKSKEKLIDPKKNLILKSAHPSPFSAHNFFGCKHFSKANEYLLHNGMEEINWTNID